MTNQSERTLSDIFCGKTSPIYWDNVKRNNEHVCSNFKIKSFLKHALESIFAFSPEDIELCIHYKPITPKDKCKKSNDIIKKENIYKGPPKSLWVANGHITSINDKYVYIKDISKLTPVKFCSLPHNDGEPSRDHYSKNDLFGMKCRRKKGCKGIVLVNQGHPIKQLDLSLIQDITTKDNSRIDLSTYLEKAYKCGLGRLKNKCLKKKQSLLKKIDRERNEMAEKINIAKLKKAEKEALREYWGTIKDNHEKVEDYWAEYYDADYAPKMVKEY